MSMQDSLFTWGDGQVQRPQRDRRPRRL